MNQKGFHVLPVLLVVIVVGVIGFAAWRVIGKSDSRTSVSNDAPVTESDSFTEMVAWEWNGQEWQSTSEAPDCIEPVKFAFAPSDLSKATSVLYPGQTRGQYKPHGGFRFDGAKNDEITVKAIYDGYLVSGSRYIEAGEVQYVFTFVNNCGIAYRFDHLATLSAEIQKVADTLPEAKVDDSRTTNFNNPVFVKAGDVIATSVGFKNTSNDSFDLGVYDYRKQNNAASSGAYITAHQNELSQAAYALCWLDMFSDNDSALIKSLPASDAKSGNTSDYCK